MELIYFKTDRNGTKYYYDYTCPRCGGAGGANQWELTGWTCYACGGTGMRKEPKIVKEYTPEYEKVLRENRARRYQKRTEKLQEELPQRQAEFLADHNFTPDGYTYLFLGNTYADKDKIRLTGATYDSSLNWHIDHEVDGFQFLKIHIDEVATPDYYEGYTIGGEGVADLKARKKAEYDKLNGVRPSEYVGTIGEKIDMELTYNHYACCDTQFGTMYIHTFTDKDGNEIVWKTTSWDNSDWSNGEYRTLLDIGDKAHITGTIKEHTVYDGVKQTQLYRCRVKKSA